MAVHFEIELSLRVTSSPKANSRVLKVRPGGETQHPDVGPTEQRPRSAIVKEALFSQSKAFYHAPTGRPLYLNKSSLRQQHLVDDMNHRFFDLFVIGASAISGAAMLMTGANHIDRATGGVLPALLTIVLAVAGVIWQRSNIAKWTKD